MAHIETKLPKVCTTIFTVMSQLAAEHGAANLAQGFPDFSVPGRLIDELDRVMRDGHNTYAPATGLRPPRNAIDTKTQRLQDHQPATTPTNNAPTGPTKTNT